MCACTSYYNKQSEALMRIVQFIDEKNEKRVAKVDGNNIIPTVKPSSTFDYVQKAITENKSLRDIISDVRPASANSRWNNASAIKDIINTAVTYSPIMKFTLEDEANRTFIAERYCFLGSVDDWIYVGESATLKSLVKKYVNHLGQDSFFDLF